MGKDVFLSHASQDHAMAQAVCDVFERAGVGCWLAPRDVTAGRSWGASIVQGLDECAVLLLLLTPQANASRHVIREVERADGKGAAVMTLKLGAMTLNPTLEYFLSADHWLEIEPAQLPRQLPAVLTVVQASLAQRRAAPRPAAQASATSAAATLSAAEWARVFDEMPPDDWDRAPSRGRLATLFHRLLADR